MSQFENLRASSLFCTTCNAAMPVRETLLLVLSDKEIREYLCTVCSSSLGRREISSPVPRAPAPRGHRAGRVPSSFGF